MSGNKSQFLMLAKKLKLYVDIKFQKAMNIFYLIQIPGKEGFILYNSFKIHFKILREKC